MIIVIKSYLPSHMSIKSITGNSCVSVTPKPKLPECIVRYSDYLREKYLEQPVLPDSDWPPSLGGQFIRLALIPRQRGVYANSYDSVIKVQKDYVRGNVDKILAGRNGQKSETQAKQVLKPLHCVAGKKFPLRVLIDGAPGVGKTTLSRKFSQDWASGVLLQDHNLVVLLHLRDRAVSQANTIDDFFYHDDPELHQSVVRHVRQTSGERVLLIFDGFDELSAAERSHGSLFINIIKGKVLNKCSVVVTSRPYASVGLQELASITRHVEVLGFTEELIKQCIMKTITDNPQKAEELCTQLHERMDIMSLCYIPLNCAIMLYVYQQEKFCLPKTLTELYNVFALHAIKRHTRNLFGDTAARRIRTLDKLPKEVEPQFSALCEMAYDGLIEDQLVFHEEDIEDAFPNIGDQDIETQTLALMTVAKSYSKRGSEVTCNFLHLTIQEFLAAKWAVTHTKMLDLFKKNLLNDRLRMMLLFLAGITKLDFPNVDKVFSHNRLVLTTCPPNQAFLLLCHLVYESENHKTSVYLSNSIKKNYLELSHNNLSGFEFLVVITVFSQSGCQWDVLRMNCKEHLKMYHEVCNHNVCVKEVELVFDGKDHIELQNFLKEASKFSDIKVIVSKDFDSHESITTLLSLISIPNISRLAFLSVIYVVKRSSKPLPTRELRLSFTNLTDSQFSVAFSFFLHSGYHWDVLRLKCEEKHVELILKEFGTTIHKETSVQEIELEYEGMDFVLLHDILEKFCKHLSARVRVKLNWHYDIGTEIIKRLLSVIVISEMSSLSLEFLSVVYKAFKTSGSEQRREIELPSTSLSYLHFSAVITFILQGGYTWDVLKLKCKENHLDLFRQAFSTVSHHRICVKEMDLKYDGENCIVFLDFLRNVPQIQNIGVRITTPHSCTNAMECLQNIASLKKVSKFSSFSYTSDGEVIVPTCTSTFCKCLYMIDVMHSNTNVHELHVMFQDEFLGSLKILLTTNNTLRFLEVFVMSSNMYSAMAYEVKMLIEALEWPLSINKTLVCFMITWNCGSATFERDPVTSVFVKSQKVGRIPPAINSSPPLMPPRRASPQTSQTQAQLQSLSPQNQASHSPLHHQQAGTPPNPQHSQQATSNVQQLRQKFFRSKETTV